MIGKGLFHRLFLRFLLAMVIGFCLLMSLFHVFQKESIDKEWQIDLQQEAFWLAKHIGPDREGLFESLVDAWRSTHSTIRLVIFDRDLQPLGNYPDGLAWLDMEAIKEGRQQRGFISAVESLPQGRRLVMARPWVPGFPYQLSWQLIASAVLIVGLIVLFVYPLVHSLNSAFRQMEELARQVSAGHFGRTLGIERSDEIGGLIRAFDDMSRKLEEADRLNTRLLHDVSHELRSPLSRIQVMAETIPLRPGERDECVRGINQEVELLDSLVDDLVQTARLEAKPQVDRRTRISVLSWSGELLQRLGKKVRSSDIEWITRLPETDFEIEADPQRLSQAISNLIDNSINALSERRDPRIEVSIGSDGDAWFARVADNGSGIPKEDLPHLFRRFYRVEAHRGRDRGGVGLGLSLVRAIVQAHGGEVSVESNPNTGTQVNLRFPV